MILSLIYGLIGLVIGITLAMQCRNSDHFMVVVGGFGLLIGYGILSVAMLVARKGKHWFWNSLLMGLVMIVTFLLLIWILSFHNKI